MALSSQDEKTVQALVTALSQQSESLPPQLQNQLHSIGQNLESRAAELPIIASSLPQLNSAYQQALSHPQESQEKTGAKLVSSSSNNQSKDSDRLLEHATEIFTSADSVEAAQKKTSRFSGQIASNPLKRFFGRG